MRLVTADMSEANDIRVWLNFKEVTSLTNEVELGKWPYVPTWSRIGIYIHNEDGRVKSFLVDGDMRPKLVYRHGLVWWMKRRPDK